MKKIFTSLLMMLMLIVSQVLPTAALSYDESYTTAKSYFQNLKAFQSLDEIIASESVGVETDSKAIPNELLVTDSAKDIAKTFINISFSPIADFYLKIFYFLI